MDSSNNDNESSHRPSNDSSHSDSTTASPAPQHAEPPLDPGAREQRGSSDDNVGSPAPQPYTFIPFVPIAYTDAMRAGAARTAGLGRNGPPFFVSSRSSSRIGVWSRDKRWSDMVHLSQNLPLFPHTLEASRTANNSHVLSPHPPLYPPVDARDVDLLPQSSSSASSGPSRPALNQTRSSRRARVDDDEEDEDDWRESNRQRMHSPTTHDDEHHFMPIPEDHGVPQRTRDRPASPQRNVRSSSEQPAQGPAPHPQLSRMQWTFDFLPVPGQSNQQPPAGSQPAQPQQVGGDGQPFLNFFINLPFPGQGPAPQAGAAPNNANDGGNAPANGGFVFPPFPFPFGMDMMEERDDPDRAKKLVDGLEVVHSGLVKRMQRVGGPGTSKGEVPTCSVCWESLLEPEGGGFEANAELAKAEAEQAARDAAASQQGRESPADGDGSAPASSSSPGVQSPSNASSSSVTTSECSGESKYPKVVVLPCSHAFHATCLLPWFSKPGRTTCPSCRFDIDPDSLTYTPRPFRTRAHTQAGPQAGMPPHAQGMPPPIFFGPLPPHLATGVQPGDIPSQNPAGTAPGAAGVNAQPQFGTGQHQPGQPGQPPLPPFITFDISMIIPIMPGRGPGAPPTAAGAQDAQSNQTANAAPPQGTAPPPPPPRTDNNGFRLDDTLLQDAVRTTFERVFGRAPPPAFPPPPPFFAGAPGDDGPQINQQWFTFNGNGFQPIPTPGAQPPPPGAQRPRPSATRTRPAQKRQWAPPPAPGPTLRQVVERNEREIGLRCSDVSCGLGPSDDDPVWTFDASMLRQITIRPLNPDQSGKDCVCEHKFHPSCLVSAGRVAGWGHEVKTGEPAGVDEDVEVSCPVCRAVGVISRVEWEEGACALA
ncbi:hypothetical protein C8Q80DRAFT_1141054 [Daedaleopsis nitida]|nr:hypothetical protein C8Q80DRAFT_1141054 [Daedaleopsis nitida]